MSDFVNLAFNGLIIGLLVSLLAMAITLVFGIARFPNASAGDVATVGAYAGLAGSAITHKLYAIVAFGLLVPAVVSVFFYLILFRALSRKPPVSSLIASIGVAFVIRATITGFFGYNVRNYPLPIARATLIGPLRIMPSDLSILFITLGALVVVFATLYLTPIGKRMRAVADNPDLAKASGIRANRVLIVMWVMAGLLSGLGGTLLGVKAVISAHMGWDLLIPAFAAAILGGLGNPLGAVVGGVLIGIAQELSTPFVGFTYKFAVGFLVLLITLLVRPQGLFASNIQVR